MADLPLPGHPWPGDRDRTHTDSDCWACQQTCHTDGGLTGLLRCRCCLHHDVRERAALLETLADYGDRPMAQVDYMCHSPVCSVAPRPHPVQPGCVRARPVADPRPDPYCCDGIAAWFELRPEAAPRHSLNCPNR